ncbi:MAG TPA: cupredoxin domain-containing protein [Dehalococcoidia bacterium]|nr:cupredoxin domain-containing protein [Dehalococcoidia bacterium]
MNTSKQVNVIIGLLMVGALATLLYYLWDGERQSSALERQMEENAERGGFLFSRNCSSCHGLTGKGAIERSALPGAPLNIEENRPTAPGELTTLQNRYRDTIRCGRGGTVMPAWSTAQGGPLNDFQIEQLVTLIMGTFPGEDPLPNPHVVSEAGWEFALEQVNHDTEFDPPKELLEAIDSEAEALQLSNVYGMRTDDILRIDDDPTDEVYELVMILNAPARTALKEKADADDSELVVEEATVFVPGDTIQVEDEKMSVEDAPSATELLADVTQDDTTLAVADSEGFDEDELLSIGPETMRVTGASAGELQVERGAQDTDITAHAAGLIVTEEGDTLRVERAVDGTRAAKHDVTRELLEIGDEVRVERGVKGSDAAEHAEGTEVFNGPVAPGTTITSETCGQLAAAPTAAPGTPAPPVPVTGTVAMEMGDNFFGLGGARNPALAARAGDAVTIQLANAGSNIHNMSIAGPDRELGTDDDLISDPGTIAGGGTGTLSFTLQAGTYPYQCDFHPDEMKGEITVSP